MDARPLLTVYPMIELTDSEFRYIVRYVKDNFGIDLSKKRVLLAGRLGSYLVENNFSSFTEYMKVLEQDKSGRELTNFLNKLTTNHTYFMREAEHFAFFGNHVLPELETKTRDRDLRIWCAAASTGEEPYTLAMILQDRFAGRTPRWDTTLLATDLSVKVLTTARQGLYPNDALEKVPTTWKNKYFTPVGATHMQITPAVREQVVYRRFNLMDPIVAKKPYHVVFCRNVMIYFDTPTKSDLVDRIYDVMAPGGYLFVGFTESLPRPTRFRYVRPSVYQKGV